jgi:hypothetical protein
VSTPLEVQNWPRFGDIFIETNRGSLKGVDFADDVTRMLKKRAISEKLFSYYATKNVEPGLELLRALQQKHWWPSASPTVWVMGSGAGDWAVTLSEVDVTGVVIAIDKSPEMTEIAQRRHPSTATRFVVADCVDLPSFDDAPKVIWSQYLLTSIEGELDESGRQRRLDLLSDWKRRVGPAGIVVFEEMIDFHFIDPVISDLYEYWCWLTDHDERGVQVGASAVRTLHNRFGDQFYWRLNNFQPSGKEMGIIFHRFLNYPPPPGMTADEVADVVYSLSDLSGPGPLIYRSVQGILFGS